MSQTSREGGSTELDLVLETAHEAFVTMDGDGVVRAWNREAERTFGWSREAALGRYLRDLVIPTRYRQRHDEGLRRFLETGEGPLLGKRIEISALHRNGIEFPVELTISAVGSQDGWRFHAFIHDITDRYRASDLQSRLATLVEHSADAIISRTADGVVTSWNPGAAALFGYSADEMIGRRMDRVVPSHREGEATLLIQRALAGDPVHGFETERVCKDGRTIDVSITLSPIRDDAGEIREVSMIARDITSRKAAERALAQANDELAHANDLKSRFVAITSHELRTPLTSIRGFAATLDARWTELDDADRRSFLTHIDRQAERLNRIVEDLLTLSRIDAGGVSSRPERVELEPVAWLVVHELGLESKTTLAAGDAPSVHADPDHVHRILLNFLANAHAYGAPPFRIEIVGRADDVMIRVSDEGEGVPQEFVPHLFETFAQAETHGRGTGLGLAIVKGLAETAGGEAWYEPNEPQGAAFCVALPRG